MDDIPMDAPLDTDDLESMGALPFIRPKEPKPEPIPIEDRPPRAPHPNSLANLVAPFKKGECANPGGRPKGESMTSQLRHMLKKTSLRGVKLKEGNTVEIEILEAALRQARRGKFAHFKEIFDRSDGKVPDKLSLDQKSEADKILACVFKALDKFPEVKLQIAKELQSAQEQGQLG